MTRILFVLSLLGLLALIGLSIVGLTNNQPALLMGGFFCAGPVMMLMLGGGLGRASNEFSLVRKRPTLIQQSVTNSRVDRVRQGEIVS